METAQKAGRGALAAWGKGTPLISVFLTMLILVSAFVVGVLGRLGIELLPLVDKGHLFVLLAFYGSAATVAFRMAKSLYDAADVTAVDFVEGRIRRKAASILSARTGRRPQSRYRRALSGLVERIAKTKRARLAHVIALWVPLSLFLGAVLFIMPMDGVVAAASTRGFLYLAATGVLATGILAMVLWFAVEFQSKTMRAFGLACAQLFAVYVAFLGGGVWTNYLSEFAPRVALELVDQPGAVQASIAFPATDGVLVFIGGDSRAQFVPWARIKLISAAPVSPRP